MRLKAFMLSALNTEKGHIGVPGSENFHNHNLSPKTPMTQGHLKTILHDSND